MTDQFKKSDNKTVPLPSRSEYHRKKRSARKKINIHVVLARIVFIFFIIVIASVFSFYYFFTR